MTRKEQIREALRKLAGNVGPLQTILAKVVSVNANEFTCLVEDEDVQISDVRLRPVLNTNESITVFPKTGSWVLIQRIEDDAEWIVIAVDEIDKYRIVVDDMVFEMSDNKFLIKKGADTLKDVIQLTIESVQQIVVLMGNNPDYVKLQTAMTKLNNIMQ
jgi:hypothetical protein